MGRKHALLVGCPVGGLHGPDKDLNVMQTILQNRGFNCNKICPAKRSDILDAWNDIIKQASERDAVAIYYSGHGGMSNRNEDGKPDENHRRLKYLVPSDFEDTTDNDWRGISDVELSQLLRKTTNKTKNTTVILDCCVAAHMARFPGTVKTIDPNEYGNVLKHIDSLISKGTFDTRGLPMERNPDAVVIAASAETESAYEQLFDGVQMSVLVEAFQFALGQDTATPTPISWRSIMLRMRERMKTTCPQQYSSIEGDDLRFAFSLEKADPQGALAVSFEDDGVVLDGGEIHGLKQGDTYALVPFQHESLSAESEIAEVAVENVGPVKAWACFEGVARPTQQQVDDGLKAFPKKRQLGKLAVALEGKEESTKLREIVAKSNFVQVAGKGEKRPLATVVQDSSRLQLSVHEGSITYTLRDWNFHDNSEKGHFVAESVKLLESLARTRHLLTLDTNHESAIASQVEAVLGRVEYGKQKALSQDNLEIEEGQRIYITVRNTSTTPVFISIFDVCGPSAKLLSTSTPTGRELQPNESYTLGKVDFTGRFVGSPLAWPKDTPRESSRLPETIIVVVTTDRIDLRGLETGPRAARGRGENSELGKLLDDISTGMMRDVGEENQDFVQFGLQRFPFVLTSKSSSS